MFQKTAVEKIKIYIFCSVTFFSPENRAVYEIIWKEYCTAGQAIDENMTHAHYMLDN